MNSRFFYFLTYFFILFPTLSVANPQYRIVSLNPSITELLFNLNLGKFVVGTTTLSHWPEQAKSIPTVGDYTRPMIEKIVAMKPTHVLVLKEGPDNITAHLKNSKIPYFVFSSRTLDEFKPLVTEIGNLFSVQTQAQQMIKNWETSWQEIKNLQDTHKTKSKKILIQLDHDPIIVAANDTFLNEIIHQCGFENAFSHLKNYPKIAVETLADHKPDLIVLLGPFSGIASSNLIKKFWQSNLLTQQIPLVEYSPEVISKVTPRLPNAVKHFCATLNRHLHQR